MVSILNYIGRMSKVNFIDFLDNVDVYIEPFSGSYNCGINALESGFTGKTILNDGDILVSNFWECIKENPYRMLYLINEAYKDNCEIKLMELKEKFKDVSVADDKYKAALYEWLYTTINTRGSLELDSKVTLNNFVKTSKLLSNTDIINKDAIEVIKKFDSEKAFFMIDPPYFGVKRIDKYYRVNSSQLNHEALRDEILKLKGKWVCRYADNEYIRELYKDAEIFGMVYNTRGFDEIYFTNIQNLNHDKAAKALRYMNEEQELHRMLKDAEGGR